MNNYSLKDTNQMNWSEFGEIMDELVTEIGEYFNSINKKLDAVSPILRNGAIPATIIGNKLQIIPMLPVQVKYDYAQNKPVQLLPFFKPIQDTLGIKPNILICECNTFSGESARMAASIIQESYPDAHLFYATVTQVFRRQEIDLSIFEHIFVGRKTNENFEANQREEKELNLRSQITIVPWETVEFELNDINATL